MVMVFMVVVSVVVIFDGDDGVYDGGDYGVYDGGCGGGGDVFMAVMVHGVYGGGGCDYGGGCCGEDYGVYGGGGGGDGVYGDCGGS